MIEFYNPILTFDRIVRSVRRARTLADDPFRDFAASKTLSFVALELGDIQSRGYHRWTMAFARVWTCSSPPLLQNGVPISERQAPWVRGSPRVFHAWFIHGGHARRIAHTFLDESYRNNPVSKHWSTEVREDDT